jgi:thymidylate synthase (FAD)
MSVELVWITPEVEKLIAYIARVSNPANQDNPNYEKLIQYLINHKHWSPFEMAGCCVEINTSRGIADQIMRHRSFAFQTFSTRYAEVQSFEPIEPRRQDLKNRQASYDDLSEDIKGWFYGRVEVLNSEISNLYHEALSKGIAKECARSILPVSLSTKMYMNGTIRSWIHYIEVRSGIETQKEHRDIADQIKSILIPHIPIISKAIGWSNEQISS